MRSAAPDLVTLIGGVAVMQVWAGFIEAFLSQYHGPQLYAGKIAFGMVEVVLLAVFLARSGREKKGSEFGVLSSSSSLRTPAQNSELKTQNP